MLFDVPKMIALFAYDFAHRKSHDFIIELFLRYGAKFCVLAASSRTLSVDKAVYFSNGLKPASAIPAQQLCETLKIPFHCIDHNDSAGIANLQQHYGFTLGLISGARIIPASVIEIFPEGVINFHPGKIPETSGLDAFYYSIKNNSPPGVTAHFIDWRVDAGRLLFFSELRIDPDNDPSILNFNIYQLQISSLRRVLDMLSVNNLVSTPLQRPTKNIPMTPSEKIRVLQYFPSWRAEQYHRQQQTSLFNACSSGDLKEIQEILEMHPGMLESRTPEGWTPLIVSSFNSHLHVVKFLLEIGANPNACGLKGTTVLMYAKTPMLNIQDCDTAVVDVLIRYGADASRMDMYGKTVFDYFDQDLNPRLMAALRVD